MLSLILIALVSTCSAFDNAPTMDPAIPTMAPHENNSSADSCVGQCALSFMGSIRTHIGQEKATSLLQLNYKEFLDLFADASFFEKFCSIYHNFQSCSSKCAHGSLRQLLMRSSEILDHYCVYNFEAIRQKLPCLSKVKPNKQCVEMCTSHNATITDIINNFGNIAVGQDKKKTEEDLAHGCEYITCTMHCDVPTVAHTCDFDTAQLVIDLTRRSFGSMQKLVLDTGAVDKWPQMCSDIATYRMPMPAKQPQEDTGALKRNIRFTSGEERPSNTSAPFSILSLFITIVSFCLFY